MSTDLLSPEDQAILQQARSLNTRPITSVMYDTLKFKDSEKKVEGLTRGHYFIECYDPEAKRKSYQDIGANPEIVILARYYIYSYYKEGEGLIAWTSDIAGFSESDYVALYSRKTGKMREEFIGAYRPDFKNFIAKNYTLRDPDGKEEKLLTFQTLLYVLFENTVYRMFVSNASAAGIPDGQKAPSFQDPQPLSLLHFIDTTKEEQGAALCEFKCRLGSRFKDDVEQPFYIRQFENVGKVEKEILAIAVQRFKEIYFASMKQQKDLSEKAKITDLRTEVIDAEITSDDLPDL